MSGIVPVCGTSLRLKSCPPSDLARRIAVHLLEHAAEQLIVGKSVSAQDLHDRIIRRADVVIDMREPHVVNVLRERNADVLTEHAAEIVAVQADCSRTSRRWTAT